MCRNQLAIRGPTTRLGKPGFSFGAWLLVPQMLLCGSAYGAGIYASGWVGKEVKTMDESPKVRAPL